MERQLRRGDKVTWNTSQGKTEGLVEAKVTSTASVKGHVAKATPRAQQYRVKSDKTGAIALHKAEALDAAPTPRGRRR